MLLAELEVHLSRPHAPTRRVALGSMVLPVAPPPGFGGILLGAVVAANVADVDPELHPEILRLAHALEAGHRIPQPRLRHRLQEDRVGLTAHHHRLIGDGDALHFDLDDRGMPMPHVLGALYAAGRLPATHRAPVFGAIRRGLRWTGEVGPRLVAHLSGATTSINWSTLGGRDPVHWALETLGFQLVGEVERSEIQQQFRILLRAAHPDHGGRVEDAAKRIADLTEARRILLAS